ncbi:MAG: hypothetical protein Q8P67_20715 [archaeon]|nr:hypothetical protein [archaeon]
MLLKQDGIKPHFPLPYLRKEFNHAHRLRWSLTKVPPTAAAVHQLRKECLQTAPECQSLCKS